MKKMIILYFTLFYSLPLMAVEQNKVNFSKHQIEKILNATGHLKNNTFHIGISRKDISNVKGPRDFSLNGDFAIDGDLFFQSIAPEKAFLNGDVALKENEVNPFISNLIKNNLTFQAFHQHFPSHPQIWFVHFSGIGQPAQLAKDLKAAFNATTIPFPQKETKNKKTILNAKLLEKILHGHASIGENGVVTIWVLREDKISIDKESINPQVNISTNIHLKPKSQSEAEVIVDFAMSGNEVNKVVDLMLNKFNWYQGCLYNQEINEKPQLYFDHMLKRGNPYKLAEEIRKGLDLTNSK